MDKTRLVRRFQIRAVLFLITHYNLAIFPVLASFLGTVVLLLRFLFKVPVPVTVWLLFVLPIGFLWAAWKTARRAPTEMQAFAMLDQYNECGGLLMACREVSLGHWDDQIGSPACPSIRWNFQRPLLLTFLSLIFLAASFFIPQRFAERSASLPLDISRDVQILEKQIDVLSEEAVVSEERALEIEKTMTQIQQNASGGDPVKTWEALDHLKQSLRKEADQFAASALSKTEQLADSEALTRALSQEGSELDGTMLSQAMSELAFMAMSAAAQNPSLQEALDPQLLNNLKAGTLTAEQLSKLMESLAANKAELAKSMKTLCEAGLVDLKTLELCESAGQCNMEGLAAYLNKNCRGTGQCMSAGAAIRALCNEPGKGGISRGRGDAPMTFTDPSTMDNTTFKEQILPQAASIEAVRDSQQVGVSLGSPVTEDMEASYGSSTLNSPAGGSFEAVQQPVLPRHREAVNAYFKRE